MLHCLIVTGIAAIACLWAAWCKYPFFPWNEVRLAPAFALRHGLTPYPGEGVGPLFTWIYGPVGIFVNLPATFAHTAERAVQVAFVINALVMLVPLAIIFFGAAELRARGIIVCGFAWVLALLLLPEPALLFQVADHAAIALGLLSCWTLTRVLHPDARHLATAAALCALAIWSKQIAAFLLPAQFAYLWLTGDRKAAYQYILWTAFFGLIALAVFAWLFGFRNLWLNLVAIPGRLPWAEFWPRLTLRPWSLFAQILLPGILLLIMWKLRLWPNRDRTSGRFFQIAALAAGAMLPVGLAGFFKIGGDTNLLHSWNYLLPALLLLWLARDRNSRRATTRLLGVVATALSIRAGEIASLPARPSTSHFAIAEDLIARNPQALWFPQHPVISFYADGTFWHSEDGILTRHLAGYGLKEAEFRRHLPPHLRGVVYRDFIDFPFAMQLLSEFNETVKLPYWTLHTRAGVDDTTGLTSRD